MTIITARVIKDAVNTNMDRLITLELTYPRFIHAELMTHRVFSRNSASSRAIPIHRQLDAIKGHPAEPVHWGAHQKGMQADRELEGWRRFAARAVWRTHRRFSYHCAYALYRFGAHKQFANRLTEPHSHIKVLVTSTKWANFFALRAHSAAQPEFRVLADEIAIAVESSMPVLLENGQWYLPYITASDYEAITGHISANGMGGSGGGNGGTTGGTYAHIDPVRLHELRVHAAIRVSVARCARVSFTTVTDDSVKNAPPFYNLERDMDLGDQLISADPMHASPLEHVAQPDPQGLYTSQWGNFHGWIQYRKTRNNEAKTDRRYKGSYTPANKGNALL